MHGFCRDLDMHIYPKCHTEDSLCKSSNLLTAHVISATRARGVRGAQARDCGLPEEVQRAAQAQGRHPHHHASLQEFLK